MGKWDLDEELIKRATFVFKDPHSSIEKINDFFDEYESKKGESEAKRCFDSLFKIQNPRFADRAFCIEGTPPEERNRVSTYDGVNGRRFEGLPGLLILQYSLSFLSSYGTEIEKRDSYVSKTEVLDPVSASLPYILAYLCLRDSYRATEDHLRYEYGFLSISFCTESSRDLRRSNISAFLADCGETKALIELGATGLENAAAGISGAFSPKRFALGKELGGTFVTLMSILNEAEMKRSDLKVLRALLSYGDLSRKEIADICQMPDRTASYVLLNLLGAKKVERIGDRHSPQTKYRLLKP